MTFTATHLDSGDRITWSAGHFSGADRLVGEAVMLCEVGEQITPAPTLAPVAADRSDPVKVWAVMMHVCRGRATFSGEVPDVSALWPAPGHRYDEGEEPGDSE